MRALSVQGVAKAIIINFAGRGLNGILRLLVMVLIAQKFGANLVTDAYMVAKSIPLLFLMVGESFLLSSFLPVFVDYREKFGEKEAWRIADAVFNFWTIGLVTLATLVAIFAHEIIVLIAPSLPAETQLLATWLLRLMAPIIVIAGSLSVPACLFYCYRHFTLPALTSLFFPCGMIISIFALGQKIGIVAVPVGGITGLSVQLITLGSFLAWKKRWLKFSLDFQLPGLKEIFRIATPRFITLAFGRINIIIDRIFASGLGAGYISALSYADKIVQIPVILFVSSLAKSLVPTLSKINANGNLDEMRKLIADILRLVVFVMAPVSVVFVLFGHQVVELLLQRGAFDANASRLTTIALIFYAIGIIAFSLNALLSSFFYALKNSIIPMKVGLLCCGLNLFLDAVLVRYLSHGGLALATSVVSTVSTILLLRLLAKQIGHLYTWTFCSSFIRVLMAAFLMGMMMWFSSALFDNDWGFAVANRSLHIALTLFVGLAVYTAGCHLFKVQEYRMVLELLSKKGVHDASPG